MKEVTIRIYSGDDEQLIKDAQSNAKLNFFDLLIDGEVYSHMRHLRLDICSPERDDKGALNLDNTKISMTIDKNSLHFNMKDFVARLKDLKSCPLFYLALC